VIHPPPMSERSASEGPDPAASTAEAPALGAVHLRVVDKEGQCTYMPLPAPSALIGRSQDAQVRLDHSAVSRRHTELSRDPFGRWWVRDLGSRNGTFVNGRRITEMSLRAGDELEIGPFRLRLDCEPSAPLPSEKGPDSRSIPVSEDAATDISSLSQLTQARIDTAHLATLSEFGRRLNRCEDPQQRMQMLCRLLVRQDFRGRAAAVLRLSKGHPGDAPRVLCESNVPGIGELAAASRSLLAAVLQTEAPVIASNVRLEPGMIELTVSASRDPMAVAACPLHSDLHAMDVLYVTFPKECGTTEWLALAALAADRYQQAEAVFEERRQAEAHALLERELEKAGRIQKRLIPTDPSIPGLEVAIGFRPCRWVGGDYVDVIETGDDGVVLVVADVSGKGMPAALVASELRGILHTSLKGGQSPAHTIEALNTYLCQHQEGSLFVTLALVSVQRSTGAVTYIDAGHPPPLILGPEGATRWLAAYDNLPLGIEEQRFRTHEDALEPGHLLMMFTDGLTEQQGADGRMLGIEGLSGQVCQVWRDSAALALGEVAARLTRRMERTEPSGISLDDKSFLLARRPFPQ
jgi:phosphoserine phosphatase RsbU/P